MLFQNGCVNSTQQMAPLGTVPQVSGEPSVRVSVSEGQLNRVSNPPEYVLYIHTTKIRLSHFVQLLFCYPVGHNHTMLHTHVGCLLPSTAGTMDEVTYTCKLLQLK